MPLNLSFTHIMVVMVVALIVLGPDKLPDAARSAAKMIAELRRMSSGLQAEVRETFGDFADPFVDLVHTVTGGVVSATSGQVSSAEAAQPPAIPTLRASGPAAAVGALPALPALGGATVPGTFVSGPPVAEPIYSPLATAPPEGFSPGPPTLEGPGPAVTEAAGPA